MWSARKAIAILFASLLALSATFAVSGDSSDGTADCWIEHQDGNIEHQDGNGDIEHQDGNDYNVIDVCIEHQDGN